MHLPSYKVMLIMLMEFLYQILLLHIYFLCTTTNLSIALNIWHCSPKIKHIQLSINTSAWLVPLIGSYQKRKLFDVISRKTNIKFVLIFISCDEIVTHVRIKKEMNNVNTEIGFYLPDWYHNKIIFRLTFLISH